MIIRTLLLALLSIAPPDPPRYDTALLADALMQRLTYPSSLARGKPYQVAHCRRAPQGCRARIDAFAALFVDVGRRYGVSPWLLAAMAVRESALNPFAVGRGGEHGILQLHPRRRDARRLRFVTDERYRDRCRRVVGACQREVVDLAARILRRAIEQCGSPARGLAQYNSGRCDSATSYPRRVEVELLRLYRYAAGEQV